MINKEFVDRYIDKMIATPEGDDTLHLQVKLFTGEVTDKYLQNFKSRTDHTFKLRLPPIVSEKGDCILDMFGFFSIGRGRNAHGFFEESGKVVVIVKAGSGGNIFQ